MSNHSRSPLGEVGAIQKMDDMPYSYAMRVLVEIAETLSATFLDQGERFADKFFTESPDANDPHMGYMIGATVHLAKAEAVMELINSMVATTNSTFHTTIPLYDGKTTLEYWIAALLDTDESSEWVTMDTTAPQTPDA